MPTKRLALTAHVALLCAVGVAARAQPAGAAPTQHFIWQYAHTELSPAELVLVEDALTQVVTRFGHQVVPAEAIRQARVQLSKQRESCALKPEPDVSVTELRRLGMAATLCGRPDCQVENAMWTMLCAEKTGCVVELRMGFGKEYRLLVPSAQAKGWQSVAQMADALKDPAAGWALEDMETRRKRWAEEGRPEPAKTATPTPQEPPEFRTTEKSGKPTSSLEVNFEHEGGAPLWALYSSDPGNKPPVRTIPLDGKKGACMNPPGNMYVPRAVYARRVAGQWELTFGDEAMRACALPLVSGYLKKVKPTVTWLNLRPVASLPRTPTNGAFVPTQTSPPRPAMPGFGAMGSGPLSPADFNAMRAKAAEAQRRRQAERKTSASDPVLVEWRLPDGAFERCLAGFPFTKEYARLDRARQTTLDVELEVTFDANGFPKGSRVTAPTVDAPAPTLTASMRKCLEAEAMKAQAPCSAQGGVVLKQFYLGALMVVPAKR